MEAIILAGGFGTRLKPLTYTRAKPLLPILNKPMISYLIESLPSEVDRVIIAANYKREQMEEYFERNDFGREIVINEEPKPLGTGGAVKFAEKYITGTFLVLNSDIISSLEFTKMIELHRSKRSVATISLWPVENVSEFGVVKIEKDGRITAFVEKPRPEEAPSNLINAGAYCLEQEVLDYIDTDRLVSMEQEVFPRIIDDGKPFYGYEISGFWIDVGRVSSYIDANMVLLDRMNKKYVVGEDCKIEGRIEKSSIGNKVKISEGAEIISSVVLDGTSIDKDAVIRNSVIGENCKVKDGAKVINSVVGDGEIIEENGVVEEERVWTKPIPEGYPRKQVGNVIRA
ncbi:MAG TPA: NDP-sugar synthase [Thermoplasmatales archaeon]|nr:NDP-sugar synthase [Thermoplasmatales archaeon]